MSTVPNQATISLTGLEWPACFALATALPGVIEGGTLLRRRRT